VGARELFPWLQPTSNAFCSLFDGARVLSERYR
jgi:hypothetical protein